MTRISLCMIVKDEEKFLADCLDSVKGLVDEMIIVDTGSKDRTKDIAKAHGAKIVHFFWQDDFALARNESLRHATGDWILVLDADERIETGDHERIRNCTKDESFQAYGLVQRNYTDSSNARDFVTCDGDSSPYCKYFKGFSPNVLVRLFRPNPQFRFEGRIHETIEKSVAACGGKIKVTSIPIHHLAYRAEEIRKKSKDELYEKLGNEKVTEDPTNPRGFFELGVLHLRRNEFAVAQEFFEKVRDLNPRYPKLYAYLIDVYLNQGTMEKVVDSYRDATRYHLNDDDTKCSLALSFVRVGKFESALALYSEVAAKNTRHVVSLVGVAVCSYQLKKARDALFFARAALKLDPDNVLAKKIISNAALSPKEVQMRL